jgi:hypothetical protein
MARIDNDEGTMAWVETSLRYARSRNRSGLVKLLETVRAEVVLEMKLATGAPLVALPGGIKTRR